MENDKHGIEAATNNVTAKPEAVSKKSGIFNALRRSLAEPKPIINALDALADVQSPTLEPPPHGTVREAGIAGDTYKVDDQACGGPTR